MLTFSDFFKHGIFHVLDFQLHFSTTKCNDQCFFPLVQHKVWSQVCGYNTLLCRHYFAACQTKQFLSLIDSCSPGYCWIRSCMLCFCITVPLVLFFPLIDGRVRSRAISALAGGLPLFLDDNVDDVTLEQVWWTGFLEGPTTDLWNLFPRPPRLLWRKWGLGGFGRHQ